MSKEIALQPADTPRTSQTPFERFKAAVPQVMTVSKSSLSKSAKKTNK